MYPNSIYPRSLRSLGTSRSEVPIARGSRHVLSIFYGVVMKFLKKA